MFFADTKPSLIPNCVACFRIFTVFYILNYLKLIVFACRNCSECLCVQVAVFCHNILSTAYRITNPINTGKSFCTGYYINRICCRSRLCCRLCCRSYCCRLCCRSCCSFFCCRSFSRLFSCRSYCCRLFSCRSNCCNLFSCRSNCCSLFSCRSYCCFF